MYTSCQSNSRSLKQAVMAARESKKPQNKTDKRIVGSQKRRKKIPSTGFTLRA